ncbi:hypothetical protein [Aquimarina sediminis]|uniref:hypothetical protein n=1 Tax=Aquimarina sediminis TaxID=2070536 RepID=UPI000CA0817A|nr:hypothetical protein [Aquimarina sediminis]
MTLPKNKNIRKITVNNIQYYWSIKYDEDYGLVFCTIGLVDKPNFRFSFSRGVDNSHVRYIQNGIEEKDEIEAITPKLVANAIVFANKNLDWKNNSLSRIISDSEGFKIES